MKRVIERSPNHVTTKKRRTLGFDQDDPRYYVHEQHRVADKSNTRRRILRKEKLTGTKSLHHGQEEPPQAKEDSMIRDALMDHQFRTLKYVQRYASKLPGMLLWWTMGWGKTRGAIFLLEKGWNIKGKIVVITRATALHAFFDELKKLQKEGWNFDASRYQSVSYESFCKHPKEYEGAEAIVMDEAHYIRNSMSQRYPIILKACSRVRVTLALSGTAAVNHPCDVGSLINCIISDNQERKTCTKKIQSEEYYGKNRQPFLPTTRTTWDHRYGENTQFNLKHLKYYISSLVSYFEGKKDSPDYKKHFPEVKRKTLMVPMHPAHYKRYLQVEKEHRPKIDGTKRRKISKKKAFDAEQKVFSQRGFDTFQKGMGMEQVGSMEFLAYTMHLRQASNYVSDDLATKLRAVMAHVLGKRKENPNYKVVIHSNFLRCGIDYFSRMFHFCKIPFSRIDGSTKDVERQIDCYNKGKTKVMLLSSAGSEGLNLMATNEMFIVELHWNKTKPEQTEHRVIRYDSHAQCEGNEVTVYHLVSTIPKGFKETDLKPVDHMLHKICTSKQDAIDNFKTLVQKACIHNVDLLTRSKALSIMT